MKIRQLATQCRPKLVVAETAAMRSRRDRSKVSGRSRADELSWKAERARGCVSNLDPRHRPRAYDVERSGGSSADKVDDRASQIGPIRRRDHLIGGNVEVIARPDPSQQLADEVLPCELPAEHAAGPTDEMRP